MDDDNEISRILQQLSRDFDKSTTRVVWESIRFFDVQQPVAQQLDAQQTYNVVGLSPSDIRKSIIAKNTPINVGLMLILLNCIEVHFPELNHCDQVLLRHKDSLIVRFVFSPTGRRGRIAGRIAQLDTAVLEQTMALRRGTAYNDPNPRRKYMCDSCGIKHQDYPNTPLSDVLIGLGVILLYCSIIQLAIHFII